ncbi:hypothetical protein Enr13x_31200 [Stieleria neptunia]|uniref:PEP-CTERM protein-sorting domain-containing protein n=1 Tax=Stieleria neptunia TaxID=2527979 RepID=A0A518HQZ1_9BACT|nr:hypothetical protein [Stieleria neptunia]QDV43265.1 hypothetical protein Enr13x_31200 [Stieleria neptunia]
MILRFLSVAALVIACLPAQAGFLGSVLSFDGTPDVLRDDSVSFFADDGALLPDGSGGFIAGSEHISVGDRISGLLKIDQVGPAGQTDLPTTDHRMIGLFSFAVTKETVLGNGDIRYELGAIPSASAGSIDDILGTSFGDDAMIGVFTGIDSTNILTGSFAAAVAALTSPTYSLDAVLGIDLANNPLDYLEADFTGDADANSDGKITFAELAGLGPGATVATESGGFSVLSHTLGASTHFIPVPSVHQTPPVPFVTTFHDVALSGTLTNSEAFGVNPDYTIQDTAILVVNAVPEPSSGLAWITLLGLGVYGRRRKHA